MKFRVGMSVFFKDGSYARIVETDAESEYKPFRYLKFDRPVGSTDRPTRWGFYSSSGESNHEIAPQISEAFFEFRKRMSVRFTNGRTAMIVDYQLLNDEGLYVVEFNRTPVLGGEKKIKLSDSDESIEFARWFLPKNLVKGTVLCFEDGTDATLLDAAELSERGFTAVNTSCGEIWLDTFGRVLGSDNYVFEIDYPRENV